MFYAVPTFYAGFLASPAAPQRAELKMRRCVSAGEALPTDVGRRWSERYGVDILDGLGSTEMLHIFLFNRPGDVKYGTSGMPVPGYDIRLVDDEGEIIKTRGEMGELQVRGPTSAIMYGTIATNRARPFSANGRARATSTSRMRTASSSTAAGATTCSRSAACMSRRSRSRACCKAIPTCSKPPSWLA